MENHDKIYTQFKEASGAQEQKGFDRMEAVWNRVEEKLDRKKERKAAIWWKYTGIAAVMLLFVTVGLFMLQPNNGIAPKAIPANNVTVIDTQKVKETFNPETVVPSKKQEVVTSTPKIKSRAEEIIETVSEEKDADTYYLKGKTKIVPGTKVVSSPTPGSFVITDSVIKSYAKGGATVVYTGVVTSTDDGLPLPGANVTVKGSPTIVLTDMDGKYSIEAQKGSILEFNYIGFKRQEVMLADQPDVTVALNSDSNTLSEVVVVGYGTQTKRNVTSAVTSVTAKSISRESRHDRKEREKQEKTAAKEAMYASPATAVTTVTSKTIEGKPKLTAEQILQSQVPGLNVTTDKEANDYNYYRGNVYQKNKTQINNDPAQTLQGRTAGLTIKPANGQPGANSAIAIRGINTLNPNQEPLYVIDGVPMDSASARSLNSSEIKSVTVLKDASATAIYGSRAANGVIIVNTKDGNDLTPKERRKMRREQRKASKEASASQKDFEKAQEEQRRADEAEERERQNAFEAEQKRRMTEKIKVDREEYESFEENKFENPATAPLSTFSIDVDNASYTNIRRFINNGETVPKDAVRVEEMINFFKYSYSQPTGKDPFSINTEYSDCPWNPQHRLLKIGLQGKDIPQAELPASNFVFLIDVSGSMEAQNKLPLLKESMKILVKQMRAKDRIAIVVYAGAAGMVLPSTSGSDKAAIIAALDKLSAGGSTAGGAGIELAYKTAQEHFIKGGNNRVILATDGDFNVGASSDKDMQTLIEEKRKSGVFLTCLGYGMGNYKDSKLETLSDKGNGNYAYIDNMDEADRFLDKEFRGSMYAIAKDVKIQIEFNPNHVQAYRLIGYENRKLRNEDFTNDAIDAGELGSGHTVTALYEIIPPGVKDDFTTATDLKYSTVQPTGTKYSSELATVKFRYKKPDGDTSTEMVQIIPDTAQPLMNATGDFKFAAAVAWFGLKLRDSNLVPNKDIEAIKKLAKEGRLSDPEGYRAEFIRLAGRIE